MKFANDYLYKYNIYTYIIFTCIYIGCVTDIKHNNIMYLYTAITGRVVTRYIYYYRVVFSVRETWNFSDFVRIPRRTTSR